MVGHYQLIFQLFSLDEHERLLKAFDNALPVFKRHLQLNPDDYNARTSLVLIYFMAGKREETLSEISELTNTEALEGKACYNLACVLSNLNDIERAFVFLRLAILKRFGTQDIYLTDPDLAALRGTPEFEELMKELEAKIAQEKHG
jgi:tetratricopeptide (TPR) repeat protein